MAPQAVRTAGGKKRSTALTFSTLNVQGLNGHTLRMLLADGPEEGDTQRRATDTWLQNDVVGITETHARAQHEVWAADSSGRFLCGEIPPDSDPAGGVGLVLSTQEGVLSRRCSHRFLQSARCRAVERNRSRRRNEKMCRQW